MGGGGPAPAVNSANRSGRDLADTYENHPAKQTGLERSVGKVLNKFAPIRTHERVMGEVKGSLFGVEVGITLSQLDLQRKGVKGVEVIQVVNQDGSSNVETVLGRLPLSRNHRIELQGPALNSSVTPGELSVGARFIGVGLTSDVTSAMDHDAVSYTVEVKLTERSVVELAALGGAGAAGIAAGALESVAGATLAEIVSDAVLGAVPILSAGLALASVRRAVHVVRDPTASGEMKTFAVAHAIGDSTRVFFPLIGTLGNAALVLIAGGLGWLHHRHAAHAPPTGPPG